MWLNTAHQGEEEAIKDIEDIRTVSNQEMCILLDTKGPETLHLHKWVGSSSWQYGDCLVVHDGLNKWLPETR